MNVSTIWMRWRVKRNGNDGRRPSGVGWTTTRAHIRIPATGKSLCGLEPQFTPRVETHPESEPPPDACKKCLRKQASHAG